MKVTKLEHACLDIRIDSDCLIIDPGIFSKSLTDVTDISALVITHIHPDHFDREKLKVILQQNPATQIFTTAEVAEQLADVRTTVPEIGMQYAVGLFNLEFFGGQHATILDSYPPAENFGILVNEALYYPGDALTACPKPHHVLAVPSMAPWLKTSEAAAFVQQDAAEQIFPTHNHFLSEDGENLMNRILSSVAEQANKVYVSLKPGESLEV